MKIGELMERIELKPGIITFVDEVPKSEKLLYLKVVFADGDVRDCVTNIKNRLVDWRKLFGRKMLFVTNLKPTKIMGILSTAMIHAQEVEKVLYYGTDINDGVSSVQEDLGTEEQVQPLRDAVPAGS